MKRFRDYTAVSDDVHEDDLRAAVIAIAVYRLLERIPENVEPEWNGMQFKLYDYLSFDTVREYDNLPWNAHYSGVAVGIEYRGELEETDDPDD